MYHIRVHSLSWLAVAEHAVLSHSSAAQETAHAVQVVASARKCPAGTDSATMSLPYILCHAVRMMIVHATRIPIFCRYSQNYLLIVSTDSRVGSIACRAISVVGTRSTLRVDSGAGSNGVLVDTVDDDRIQNQYGHPRRTTTQNYLDFSIEELK